MAGLDGKTHTEVEFPQRVNDPAALARSEPLAPVTGQLIFAQRSSLQGKLFDAPIPEPMIRNGDFRRFFGRLITGHAPFGLAGYRAARADHSRNHRAHPLRPAHEPRGEHQLGFSHYSPGGDVDIFWLDRLGASAS